MVDIAFALLGIFALLAFLDWRRGLYLCVVMAMLQDPMRKLVTDKPTYFILFTGIVFGAAWIGAFANRVSLAPWRIHGWDRFVGKPYLALMGLVVIQALHSLARWGAPVMTVLGLLFFLAPALAVAFAYQFAVRTGMEGVRKWMWLYTACAAIALASVYLEYKGVAWPVLGEVGKGIVIYDVGRALNAFSGFFRASEVAAWHSAAVACFSFLLLAAGRRSLPRWVLAAATLVLMIAIGLLTGRRKLLVMVAIFLISYTVLNLWFQRGVGKAAVVVGAAGLLVFAIAVSVTGEDLYIKPVDTGNIVVSDDNLYEAYTIRGSSVVGDIPERFERLGVAPVGWATTRFGYFGAGLGVATQGAEKFAPASLRRGGAGEGGLGKLTVELGIPGLLIVGWLAWAFTIYIGRVLATVAAASPAHARVGYGLVAFLVANVATFSVATQVFGDIFVLLFMGITTGFLLALPVITGQEMSRQTDLAR